jgi:hypothetical protein
VSFAWARVRFRVWLRSKIEDFVQLVVWWAPPAFVYWAALRLLSNATTGPFGARLVSDVTWQQALDDWRNRRGGDRAWRKE